MVKPEPSSGTCNNNLPVSGVISSGSQSTFPPTNAIDDKLNTKWWSTFIVKPFITLDSGGLKSVSSVDFAWADGSSYPYFFDVSVSTDGTTFSNVLSGTSTGTTTLPEKYTFPQTTDSSKIRKNNNNPERGRFCKQHSADI
jgi:F5/8 type C domain